MATPPSKHPSSCSPIQSRPTYPRNSDVSNPIRSFSGSPFPKPSIIASQMHGFNPNTPANSPSGYPRRNSIGRENIVVSLRDSEEKENSKDQILKQDRVSSSASLKGTKNFMSPTISATSKINISPRKRILTERNEPIRTSISFSDGKSPYKEDLDLKPEKGLNQKKEVSFDPIITYVEDKEPLESNEAFDYLVNSSTKEYLDLKPGFQGLNQMKEVSFHPNITRVEDKEPLESNEAFDYLVNSSNKEDWDLSSESVSIANDCVTLDPSFQISPRASCSLPSPALAPLDADPSMPPYDPKTNYLSPRPRFLHYKPNSRIELYLKRGRDGKQLEESFASESSSDTEVTEEETVSNDSQKEYEDASSGDVVEEEEEEKLLVSEPNPIHISERTVVEAKRVRKSNFFTRTKFTALLLILAGAFLWASFSNSPMMEPSVINNLSFPNPYVPSELSEYIRDNVRGLAQRFGQWVYQSLSYFCNVIVSFNEKHKSVHLKFVNLTNLLEDGLLDNYLLVDHSTFGSEIKYESNELVPTIKGEVDIEPSKQEEDQPIKADENFEEAIEGGNCEALQNIEEVVEGDSSNDDREFECQEMSVAHDKFDVSVDHIVPESEEVNIPEAEVTEPANLAIDVTQEKVQSYDYVYELQSNADVIDQRLPIPQAAGIQLEVFDSRQSLAQNDTSSTEIEATIAEIKQESFASDTEMTNPESTEPESMEMAPNGIKKLFSAKIMMGISLFSFSVISVTACSYMKNRRSTTPHAKITFDQVPLNKKLDLSPLSLATGHTVQERISSRNWQRDVETVGESCPSEMSSFQYSSSSYYSKKGTSEAQSQDKKPKKNSRRESFASSDYSTESPSYGSFTTYENISSKHGNGEVSFTPVRRSSRIRNQATSP